MRIYTIGITIAGVLLLLLAPMLGTYLTGLYLRLTEGTETATFLCILEGCIRSIQILGGLTTAYGIFCRKSEAKTL